MKLYLDIDDTLIRWTSIEATNGKAAPGAKDFLLWAMANFEVQWLTYWFPEGSHDHKLLTALSGILDIPAATLHSIPATFFIFNPFNPRKVDALDVDEPWVWVEDDVLWSRHEPWLEHNNRLNDYYTCNVTRQPNALARVRKQLTERYQLEI
jgi:hypothetical protein